MARRPGRRWLALRRWWPLPLAAMWLAACGALQPTTLPPTPTPPPLTIAITADGETRRFAVPTALTVREALTLAGIALGDKDRLEPPPFTRLTDGLEVRVTRIRETFETEQAVVPFPAEVIPNEGLPRGERRLLQAGVNGLEEITYRTVFEDGVQVTRSVINRVLLQEPVAEIVTIGAQTSFTIVPITGTLAYISGGNAWVMRGDSSKRTPLTTSGDLDGVVFDVAPNGAQVLYSRAYTNTAAPDFNRLFNTLWVITATTQGAPGRPFSLPVSNTLYAEWSPVETISPTIAFATAGKNPRGPVPWQANNDLWLLNWGQNPRTRRVEFAATQIVETNAGGLYGWWGTGYAFAPDGARMAYARTDSVGVIDLATAERTELTRFPVFNSRQEWAWYPSLRWATGGDWLYTVTHGPPLGLELPEDSPAFDVIALSARDRRVIPLVPRAGLYANPVPAPPGPATEIGERPAPVALLQAVDPNNSPVSRYRLVVMDRDGSNLRVVFPPEGQPGLETGAALAWSPDGRLIALVYDGNLWLIDPETGAQQQLTGDGLTTRIEWGP